MEGEGGRQRRERARGGGGGVEECTTGEVMRRRRRWWRRRSSSFRGLGVDRECHESNLHIMISFKSQLVRFSICTSSRIGVRRCRYLSTAQRWKTLARGHSETANRLCGRSANITSPNSSIYRFIVSVFSPTCCSAAYKYRLHACSTHGIACTAFLLHRRAAESIDCSQACSRRQIWSLISPSAAELLSAGPLAWP